MCKLNYKTFFFISPTLLFHALSLSVFVFVALSFAGISIVLNLTPDYDGASVWFNNVTAVAEKIEVSKKEVVKGGLFLWRMNRPVGR